MRGKPESCGVETNRTQDLREELVNCVEHWREVSEMTIQHQPGKMHISDVLQKVALVE